MFLLTKPQHACLCYLNSAAGISWYNDVCVYVCVCVCVCVCVQNHLFAWAFVSLGCKLGRVWVRVGCACNTEFTVIKRFARFD